MRLLIVALFSLLFSACTTTQYTYELSKPCAAPLTVAECARRQ